MKELLLIEDDPELISLLRIHLNDLNFNVTAIQDGPAGLKEALDTDFDLILLDLTLPGLDGIEICKQVRRQKDTPIVMLTAKSEEIDRVLGLEIGADDYITKPFSIREVQARIKAVMRRSAAPPKHAPGASIRADELEIEMERRKVLLRGNRVDLSPKEFELLVLLASNPGRNYSRTEILNLIWGYNFDGYEHTVNSHINRLRAKIESDMANPTYVLTTWGVGYKFNEDIIR